MSELTKALRELHELDTQRIELMRTIWEHAKAAEPELAHVAAEQWPDDQTGAAVWLCDSRGGISPAELIAAGRCDLVIQKIYASIHGIYG